MKTKRNPHAVQWLLAAGLAFGMASANAAGGYTIRHQQERLVTAGMTTAEVREAIGSPITRVQYRSDPGPTWTYDVADVMPTFPDGRVVFDVNFGANGRVISAGESTAMDSSSGD